MNSFAFAVLTHDQPGRFLRLVDSLNRVYGNPVIVCHHDFSRCPLPKDSFPPNCHFVSNPVRTAWAEFSLLEASVLALKDCLPFNPRWITLLSGADYPLRSREDVERDLAEADADAYLAIEPIDPPRFLRHWQEICAGRYLKSPLPPSWRCFAGSQWMTLSPKAVELLLRVHAGDQLLREHFRNTPCPDEAYFHTILGNSPEVTLSQGNRRYVDWSRGNPTTLAESDLPAMLASGAHFARKFDPAIDSRVLDRLDALVPPAGSREPALGGISPMDLPPSPAPETDGRAVTQTEGNPPASPGGRTAETSRYIGISASVRPPVSGLVEWISHHRAIGVGHFHLSVTDGLPEVRELIDNAGLSGFVSLDVEPGAGNPSPFGNTLEAADGHPFWITRLEADEFINLKICRDLRTFLLAFEQEDAVQVVRLSGGISFPDPLRIYRAAALAGRNPHEYSNLKAVGEQFSGNLTALHIQVDKFAEGNPEHGRVSRENNRKPSPGVLAYDDLNSTVGGRMPESEVPISGFIHVAAVNDWLELLRNQIDKAARSGLLAQCGTIWLGVVGPDASVLDQITGFPPCVKVAFHRRNLLEYEFPTLQFLQDHCRAHQGFVWYAHLKGVVNRDPGQKAFRSRLEEFVLVHHRVAAEKLSEGYRVAAGFGSDDNRWPVPGNFWWATSGHIASLPPVSSLNRANRWEAERWISMNGVDRFYWYDYGDMLFQAFQISRVSSAAGRVTTNGYHGWNQSPVRAPGSHSWEVMISAHAPSSLVLETSERLLLTGFTCMSAAPGAWKVVFKANGIGMGTTSEAGFQTIDLLLHPGTHLLEIALEGGAITGAHTVWALRRENPRERLPLNSPMPASSILASPEEMPLKGPSPGNPPALTPDRLESTTAVPQPSGGLPGPKILVGICSCRRHHDRRKAVRDSWLSLPVPGMEVLFFTGQGGDALPDVGESVVELPVDDGYHELPAKVLSFFRHALKTASFDWLFKCDDDTYLALDRLGSLTASGHEVAGNGFLRTRGSPSGGAGYLLSRRVVEALVADGSIPGTGAEDVLIGEAAVRIAGSFFATERLCWDASRFPARGNDVITSHWCTPERLLEIHREMYPGPGRVFDVRHAHWTDRITLYDNGHFARHEGSCTGKWEQNGPTLHLRWRNWAEEIVEAAEDDGYTSDIMTLRPLEEISRATVSPKSPPCPAPERNLICSCTLAYPRLEMHFIAEWIEYHLALGISRIFLGIHINDEFQSREQLMPAKRPYPSMYELEDTEGDVLSEFHRRISPYRKSLKTFLYRRHARGINEEGMTQTAFYRDVLERFRHDYRWIAVHDVDEFLVPQGHDMLTEALREIPPEVAALQLRQVICEERWTPERKPLTEPVLSRYRRVREPVAYGHGSKTITRMEAARELHVHHSVVDGSVSRDHSLLLYHYRGFPSRTEVPTGYRLPVTREEFDLLDDRPQALLRKLSRA